MAYSLVTYEIKIGDSGVTQASDGGSGTVVSVDVNIYPEFGSTILNAFQSGAIAGADGFAMSPQSDNSWSVSSSFDSSGNTYPMASGTLVATVLAIVG